MADIISKIKKKYFLSNFFPEFFGFSEISGKYF